jgi:hypothetical protein
VVVAVCAPAAEMSRTQQGGLAEQQRVDAATAAAAAKERQLQARRLSPGKPPPHTQVHPLVRMCAAFGRGARSVPTHAPSREVELLYVFAGMALPKTEQQHREDKLEAGKWQFRPLWLSRVHRRRGSIAAPVACGC